ncbi:hypothetical protein AVEN_137556-1 [Araneus ventricosus]|uniref:Uncharacterized protein n=1 Tax=Araneus ventricosus TaxID=182803 RepID=A0A4Y2U9X1_ARAVE|nr:hypothetical protein AVEN_137556-1 [Araneus ventricosus]
MRYRYLTCGSGGCCYNAYWWFQCDIATPWRARHYRACCAVTRSVCDDISSLPAFFSCFTCINMLRARFCGFACNARDGMCLYSDAALAGLPVLPLLAAQRLRRVACLCWCAATCRC